MLSFDLSSLESKPVRVDGLLEAADPVWEEGDPRPADSIHVSGRLSSAGTGRYYFSGHLEGKTETSCRRCLADVTVPVEDDVNVLFAEAGEDEIDDPDVYILDSRARELDLREAIREQWLLAVPPLAECREDCKGLCPKCGADLNAGPCGCETATDPRWDALRDPREP